MHILVVSIHVKPDRINDFIQATKLNHEGSLQEEGCHRFDVLQDIEEETHFLLYEVYNSPEALDAHRNTPHFYQWRDSIEGMLAESRTRESFKSVWPQPWK